MTPAGNTTFRFRDVTMSGLAHVLAPQVVPSTRFEELLEPARQRLRLPANLLERVSGVRERRWWDEDDDFQVRTAEAGSKALAEAGVEPADVGLMINTSVSRPHLEPSVAVAVHDEMGLPSSALNFDITSACVGFVKGIVVAPTMIEAGHIEHAVIVNGENVRRTQEQTIERLGREDATRADYANQFATLTLGDGAAAAVISRSTSGRDGHRLVGGVARAGTQHHELCVGSVGDMRTDTKALLTNGLKLVVDAWSEAEADGFSWTDAERVITHQISTPYTEAFVNSVGVDPQRVPITFDQWGNVGPASIAMTLSDESKRLNGGDKVVALGVGSGLNTLLLEFEW